MPNAIVRGFASLRSIGNNPKQDLKVSPAWDNSAPCKKVNTKLLSLRKPNGSIHNAANPTVATRQENKSDLNVEVPENNQTNWKLRKLLQNSKPFNHPKYYIDPNEELVEDVTDIPIS
eukprot:NODE_11635_length_442_cov_8.169279_g10979_i0.p1 GENE.NODE_11635_length_442_cov_8.169279_g10979_i0~~NODE_11635_length_442_cov_8.169279_g10979_i0.p1  ORF type:complete len:118 (-),score=15.06 NODE_11635_length_442_cov_8.169279_g10979_i0:68-421(-)